MYAISFGDSVLLNSSFFKTLRIISFSVPKIDGLLRVLTIRLNDENFVKWNYQLQSVLQGYDMFGHFDGTFLCPKKYVVTDTEDVTTEITEEYHNWIQQDKALLSLLIVTVSDEAIEYVVGRKSAREAWLNLIDQYASVSKARVNQLKMDFYTIQKGADTIDKFLLRLKHLRDQLSAAGIKLSDDDVIIAALNGLPPEFDIIKTILVARDTPVSLKDFRAYLLTTEKTIKARLIALSHQMTGLLSVDVGSSSHQSPAT